MADLKNCGIDICGGYVGEERTNTWVTFSYWTNLRIEMDNYVEGCPWAPASERASEREKENEGGRERGRESLFQGTQCYQHDFMMAYIYRKSFVLNNFTPDSVRFMQDRKELIVSQLSLSLSLSPTHTHTHTHIYIYIYLYIYKGGAHGVMVIVLGNGHGDTSSNPGRDWLYFT